VGFPQRLFKESAMKRMLTSMLVGASLLAGAPGLANAAPAPAAAMSPESRADLFRLGAASPSLLQQRAGDAVLIVDGPERGRGRWHDGYDGYYSYGIGTLILTALIVGLVIASQQPYE
jgi:hypothetical protein